MGLLTLASAMLLTAPVLQEPQQFAISAKFYQINGELLLPGKLNKTKNSGIGTLVLSKGMSEKSFVEKNPIKLISAPTVRTLAGQFAQINMTFPQTDDVQLFTIKFLANLDSKKLIDLSVTPGMETVNTPSKNWTETIDMKVAPDATNIVVLDKPDKKLLLIVKAWLPTDQK